MKPLSHSFSFLFKSIYLSQGERGSRTVFGVEGKYYTFLVSMHLLGFIVCCGLLKDSPLPLSPSDMPVPFHFGLVASSFVLAFSYMVWQSTRKSVHFNCTTVSIKSLIISSVKSRRTYRYLKLPLPFSLRCRISQDLSNWISL